ITYHVSRSRSTYMTLAATIRIFDRKQKITLIVGAAGTALTAILQAVNANSIVVFVCAAITMAALASAVGDGTDQLGSRLGAGATGVLQSALGNLPELFIAIFAFRPGWWPSCRRRWSAQSWPIACSCWAWPSWSAASA